MSITKKILLTTSISTALIATAGCSSTDNYELLSMKSDANQVNATAARPATVSVAVPEENNIEPTMQPAPEVVSVTETIKDSLVINFEFDSADLTMQAKENIDRMIDSLPEDSRKVSLTLAGHTDAIGTNEYNNELSRERAQSVRDYLVIKGFTQADFNIDAYGERRPIATNETEYGREENRRVRIELDAVTNEFAVIY